MHRNKEEQGRMGNARIALWITTSFDPTLRDIVDATNESEYVYDDEPLTIDRLLQWVSNNPLLAELYASEKPSLEFRKWKALWGIIEKPESPLLVNPLPLLKEVPDLESFVRRVLTKRYTSWGLPDDLANKIISKLIEHTDDYKLARDMVYQEVIDFSRDSRWQEAYGRYKIKSKYASTYSIVKPFLYLLYRHFRET